MKAAFIFVAPKADGSMHRTQVDTPIVKLTVVGVGSYDEAVKVAAELADEGVTAFELCAGFGNEGVAMISKAVKGKASVGVVRFDCHPGMEFKSGDALFQ